MITHDGFSRITTARVIMRRLFLVACCLLSASAGWAQSANVLTQHNDNLRTGANLNETVLNTSNVNSGSFGKLFTCALDGQVYAQPLYVSNVTIPNMGTHNVIYVATEHDSVYAFDADDPHQTTPLWQVSMGTPEPAADSNCDNLVPEIGITSTPVIDPATNLLYLVAKTKVNGSWFDTIHALDITTGIDAVTPVVIQGSVPGTGEGGTTITFDSHRQYNRPGLLLLNGNIYVAFASACDIPVYHGWVFGFDKTDLHQVSVFCTSPNGSQDGIWQSGQGLLGDSGNNIYLSTGNGTFDAVASPTDFGEAFLKLDTASGLSVSDWFVPRNYDTLNVNDLDVSSGGPVGIPNTNLIVGGGKQGVLYLLDTGNMGQYHGSFNADVQDWQAVANRIYGAPVFWSANNIPFLFIWGSHDTLLAYRFLGSTFATPPYAIGPVTTPAGLSTVGALSVSSNGSAASTGIVWASVPRGGDPDAGVVTGTLYAFDADNISQELWDSEQNAARDDYGNYAKFCPPTVANGKVYLATFSNQLVVYGLLPIPPPVPTGVAATPGSGQVALSWNTSVGASSYNVKRSTVNGSGYLTVASPSTNLYTNTGLTNGVTYYYVVSAVNGYGESGNSSQVSATPHASVPAPPASFGATAGNRQVSLSWNSSAGATSYNLKRSTTSGSGYATITSPVSTSYTDTGLTNGVTYSYVVTAVNSAGESGNSIQASATPNGPSGGTLNGIGDSNTGLLNLTAEGTSDWTHWGNGGVPGLDRKVSGGSQLSAYTVVGSGAVSNYTNDPHPMSWTDGAPNASATGIATGVRISGIGNGFQVTAPASAVSRTYWIYAGGTDSGGTLTAHLSDNTAADYTDVTPTVSGAYVRGYTISYAAASAGQTLVVTWKMSSGTGSVTLSAATLAGGPPLAPTNLTAVAGNAQVSLNWNAAAGATSYNVKRSTVSGGPYATASSPTANTVTDTGLVNGRTYYYVVTAVNGVGESANSNQAAATPTVLVTNHPLDFNGDGKADLVLQNATLHQGAVWFMNNTARVGAQSLSLSPPAGWTIVGQGDFNGDGMPDLVLQDSATRKVALWYLNGTTITSGQYISTTPPFGWNVVAVGDFNGDGKPDLVLQNTSTNQVAIWYLSGTVLVGGQYISATPASGWKAVAAADINGDGKTDLILQDSSTNKVAVWYLNGVTLVSGSYVSATPPAGWSVAGVGDFSGDGKPDLVLQNASTTQIAYWYMNNATVVTGAYVSPVPGSGWSVAGPK